MIQPSGTDAERITAVGVVEAARVLQVAHAPDHVEDRRRDEQQAGDHPAQDRLRVAEDDAHRAAGALAASRPCALRLRRAAGEEQRTLIARPAIAHADPERAPGDARRRSAGPTTNWPADPPAMPNICVAPISVAARDGGKVRASRCRRRRPARRRRRRPAGSGRRSPPALLPVAKSSAPTPTAAAPSGTTFRGPSRSIADAGDEAERRIAVVEEPDHRRDADRGQAERVGQLRHHHRRGRSQRVLVEVVHGRDQPGAMAVRVPAFTVDASRWW